MKTVPLRPRLRKKPNRIGDSTFELLFASYLDGCDDIVSFARALAERGIAAVMPHYLDATGTEPGAGVFELIARNRPAWRQACDDALAGMARDTRFDAARLGVLGFSLGANLALSVAMDPPAGTQPRCVVDFFGPTQGLESHWAKLQMSSRKLLKRSSPTMPLPWKVQRRLDHRLAINYEKIHWSPLQSRYWE